METKEALKWWGLLSINEQEKYRLSHPFFSKMDKKYFRLHKRSITILYEYFKNQSI
jgi:pyrroloquinoline quinone (PQQ) biosynthesis protein C